MTVLAFPLSLCLIVGVDASEGQFAKAIATGYGATDDEAIENARTIATEEIVAEYAKRIEAGRDRKFTIAFTVHRLGLEMERMTHYRVRATSTKTEEQVTGKTAKTVEVRLPTEKLAQVWDDSWSWLKANGRPTVMVVDFVDKIERNRPCWYYWWHSKELEKSATQAEFEKVLLSAGVTVLVARHAELLKDIRVDRAQMNDDIAIKALKALAAEMGADGYIEGAGWAEGPRKNAQTGAVQFSWDATAEATGYWTTNAEMFARPTAQRAAMGYQETNAKRIALGRCGTALGQEFMVQLFAALSRRAHEGSELDVRVEGMSSYGQALLIQTKLTEATCSDCVVKKSGTNESALFRVTLKEGVTYDDVAMKLLNSKFSGFAVDVDTADSGAMMVIVKN